MALRILEKAVPYTKCQQTFPVKDQKMNRLGSVGHMVSVTTTQLCHHSMRATVDNMYTDESGSIPIKLYFWTLKF